MRFATAIPTLARHAALALALAGCAAFPRGAGLVDEVLAPPAAGAPGFAVAAVSGDNLARLAAWPLPGAPVLPWPAGGPAAAGTAIAPGDTVSLTLWTAEEGSLLTAPGQRSVSLPGLRVPASGRLFLPWLGETALAGLSPDAARARIEAGYRATMPSAQVQLQVEEGRQNAVSLVSGVTRPGSYPLAAGGATVLQMLAEGGGVVPGLNNPQLRLHRGGRVHGVALERLAAEPGLDIALRGGDRLLALADERVFLSLGAAGRQARHPFPHDGVSALDALAIIGGVTPTRADARAILILRHYPAGALRTDGSGPESARMVYTIDLTTADGLFSAGRFRIAADDLLYVSESPLIGTRDLLALAGAVFGLHERLAGD